VIRVYTSYYRECNALRHSELLECLRRNVECPVIDEVCLLLEAVERPPFEHEKLRTKQIVTRPTYTQFFQWINDVKSLTSDLSIIANSDIYFDAGIASFRKALKDNQCAALARWDEKASGDIVPLYRNDSQDAWVFRGSLKKVTGDFHVGVPRCDNRMLYELKKAGYEVINPAFSIKAFHLHAGRRPEYQNENLEHFVEPPYAYLWPHNLWSLPRTLRYNLQHPDARIGWRLDRRRLECSLPGRALRKLMRLLRSTEEAAE